MNEEELLSALESLDQSHVVHRLQNLQRQSRDNLLKQLQAIDFEQLAIQRGMIAAQSGASELDRSAIKLTPMKMLELASQEFPYSPNAAAQDASELGEQLLREGKVAALAVAGGQGSRLGFDRPKGLYPYAPMRGASLFQCFAEQLLAIGSRYDCLHPYFAVMTSDATHDQSVAAFKEAGFWGLNPDRIRFFKQGACFSLDENGDLIFTAVDQLATNPDGHGGCIPALHASGTLAHLEREGVEWVFYFQVDNPALKVCDPAFLGLVASKEAEVCVKCVRKLDPEEKVGVLGFRDGKATVIEYSELDEERRAARADDGSLLYKAGNTAIHVFRLAFFKSIATRFLEGDNVLPFHLAHKAISYVDEAGGEVEVKEPNAWKFERFIFDAFSEAEKVIALECARDDEFLPIKSATGPTSPDEVYKALQGYWRQQLRDQGITCADDARVEISGAFRDLREDLRPHLKEVKGGIVVERDSSS